MLLSHPLRSFILFLFFLTNTICSSQKNSVQKKLITVINFSQEYDKLKKIEIDSLRIKLKQTNPNDLFSKYKLNTELFYSYKFFKRDSAFHYGIRSKILAIKINDKSLIANANINLADICVSSGMYKEAIDFLKPLIKNESKENYGTLYYGLLGRCYGDMAEYSNNLYFQKEYNKQAGKYRAKALSLTEDGYFFHYFLKAFNKSKNHQIQVAVVEFEELLKLNNPPHDQALVHYMLGELYQKLGKNDQAITHLTEAVIHDISTSTKESLAIIKLSELLFKKGDIQTASILIHKANEDALFYGAQQRKIQIGAILPIIDQEIVNIVEKEKDRIQWQYIVVSSFLILAICFMLIVYYQYLKLKKAKRLIADANDNLKNINNQLRKVNEKINFKNIEIKQVNKLLLEANKIKEEYLGLFFTQYDGIFEKFNSFITSMKKSIEDENYEKVKRIILSYNLKREKDKLLENFDIAFINLFPNFIKEFNALMKEEHKVEIKNGEVLTKELRIYALIRLGITQNEIIAQILGYSVNSIYAYKTKIRNNSILNKDDFDQKLLNNTTLKF